MLPAGVRRLFRLERGTRDVAADVDAELRFHFDCKVAALMARGLSAGDAEAEARRQFGDERETRSALLALDTGMSVERRRTQVLEGWWLDLRLAVRGLARSPGLAAGVVVMLGLGIGGAAAMYALLDRLLLSVGPHIAASADLRRIYVNEYDSYFTQARRYRNSYSFETLQRFATALPAGTQLAAIAGSSDRLGGPGGPRARIALVTGPTFGVLGTPAAVGRPLAPGDDAPAAEPAAMISWGLWRERFGGTPDVLGRPVRLGAVTYTIVGVAPRGFSGLRPGRVDVWVPAEVGGAAHLGSSWRTNTHVFDAVVRVPAVSVAPSWAAALERAERAHLATTAGADTNITVQLVSVVPYQRPGPIGENTRLALIVAGVAAILCLIAAANVTNLLLLRAVRRQRETALRMALGAGRGRLVRAVLAESTLLALAGAAAAGLVAAWGGALLQKLIVRAEWQRGLMDWRVMAFAGAVGLLVGVLTGLVPGLFASRREAIAALKAGTRISGARSHARTALLVIQAALTVVLLAGLGLYTRSFFAARGTDYGMAVDRMIHVGIRPERGDSALPGVIPALVADLGPRIAAVPGVTGVAQASITPVFGYGAASVRIEGVDSVRWDSRGPFMTSIDSAFLEVTGLALRRGRVLTGADVSSLAPVALVNEAFAAHYWPGEEPLGKCLYVGPSRLPVSQVCRRVVGVVSNYRNRLLEEAPMRQYYLPIGYDGDPKYGTALVVRARVAPQTIVPALLRILRERQPDAEPEAVMAIGDIVQRDLEPWRAGTTLFALFAVLAVVLAMGGLYSVAAYAVAQRSHEWGVRIALGARARDIMRLVLASGLRPIAIGLLLGLALAVWLARFVAPLLYGTSARDPYVLITCALFLLGAAAIACAIPARNAARTDPHAALQME